MPIIDRFVARDPEMKLLKQELLPNLDVRRKVVVLLGLGGIGKTQLAIEFARKYQKSYSAVLWINGSTKEELRQSIANLASRLPQDQVSEITKSYWREEKSNVDEVVNEVLNWLSQPLNNQWLLIFDNLSLDTSEDPEESGMKRYSSKTFNIESYFPKADHGSILVTSRLVNLSRLGTVMKLEPCDELQAENILMHILGKSIEGERTSNAGSFRYHLIFKLNRFVKACQATSRSPIGNQSSRLVYARDWDKRGTIHGAI